MVRKSKAPWSCSAFYVQKQVELERGTPSLVINYKPLNDALRWIRYHIPNKKDLLQRLILPFDFKDKIFNQFSDFIIVFTVDVVMNFFVKTVKFIVKALSCLAFKFFKSVASNIGYGGILKQSYGNLELLVGYTLGTWNTTQLIHNNIKKEILGIVLCILK